MQVPGQLLLLRIFVGENHKAGDRGLCEAIVLKAREMELSGLTVLRGVAGFGNSSLIHGSKSLRLSKDLPLVIEIVETEEKITAFLEVLDDIMSSGLVTLEKVQVVR
jgi:PII-like signaling protein